jgi:hypothetical protein
MSLGDFFQFEVIEQGQVPLISGDIFPTNLFSQSHGKMALCLNPRIMGTSTVAKRSGYVSRKGNGRQISVAPAKGLLA